MDSRTSHPPSSQPANATTKPENADSGCHPAAQSNGEHLNAHGGGVIRVNGTFYLIGEDKQGGAAFANVNCFSSPDLVRWTYEGALLSRGQGPSDLGTGRIIERPKVLFNDKTGKYVLWMHVDSSSYGEAKVGVATGDTVCGKYSRWPLPWTLSHLPSPPVSFPMTDIGAKPISRASGRWVSRAEI